jgi:co-chaperonin GroES (HSP10)
MPSVTITLSDHTKPGQSLATLIGSGAQAGYTVAKYSTGIPFRVGDKVSYLSIQGSKGNSAGIIYVGDENVANDGTNQGQELAAGDVVIHQGSSYGSVHLGEIFVRGNTDTNKFNVEWHFD